MKNKPILTKIIILAVFILYLLIFSGIMPIYINMILGGIIGYILGRMD
jgi:hypothetical protein|nr:MAG TPA: Protein of unknown function (DUF1043) [Caudoviricetes sp.]